MEFILNNAMANDKYIPASPVKLAMHSDKILPGDVPAGSTIWVTDKLDLVFYDGEGNWYREADNPVPAGQPISALF